MPRIFARMMQLRNDAKQGGGKMLQCLQQHKAELSPECARLVP
jgi:hypothetical protein